MGTANFSDQQAQPPFLYRSAPEHPPHRGHAVQFYAGDAFLLDRLSGFIGAALAVGDSAIIIATQAHRDGLMQRLNARGLDLPRVSAQGRLIALDAADTLSKFMVNGFPDADRCTALLGTTLAQAAAAAQGTAHGVAAFGEMVALLWQQGNSEAALRLEEIWNGLAQTHSFSLLCAYPMHQFDREEHGESFLKICSAHGDVIPCENYTNLASEDDRSRTIASLQQKAQALTTEIAGRKRVEEELRRSKAGLEFQVAQRTSALRQLSARLLTLQDSERRRIASELHDGLGQCLIGLNLNLDRLRQTPEREELWIESEHLMQRSLAEIRTLSYVLHPPTMDVAGLVSAAQWYVEGFSRRTGIQVTFAPGNFARLPDEIELTLFRALQEALTNIHHHSGASRSEILIERSDAQVALEVKDNGCGMKYDLLKRFREMGAGLGVGLTGMCERVRDLGGDLQLDSDSNGTSVRIRIPVNPDQATRDFASGTGGLSSSGTEGRSGKRETAISTHASSPFTVGSRLAAL